MYEKVMPFAAGITGILVFIGSWIYCIVTYGFLFGVGLGWLPSGIVAVIAAFIVGWLWPLIVMGILALIYLIMK